VIAAPLIIGGSMSAHAFGSLLVAHPPRAVVGDPDLGSEAASRTTHGLSTLTPMFAGLVIALTLIGFCCYLWRSRGDTVRGIAPAWLFLLPPIAFTVQEVAERLIHAESLPFDPAHEPAFLAAIALQLPFGLAAYLIARVLLHVADVVVRAVFRRNRMLVASRASLPRPSLPRPSRRAVALREGHSSRSPPLVTI
jgi:hypothetical protein